MLVFVGQKGALGQTTPNRLNVTTTAVPFLRISPDARAGGMGDLGVATTPDAASTYYNQAKIPFAEKDLGIGLTYTPWLKDLGLNDVYLLNFAGFKKLDEFSALSLSIRYFSLGNIQFTDFNGNNLGSGHPREFSFDAGYSRKLSTNLSIALAGRYIYSNLASGYAASGSTYQPGKTFAADIKIGYSNSAVEKDYIPADLGLGASYTAVFNEDNKVMFGIDMHKLLVPVPPAATGNDSIDNINIAAYHNKSLTGSWFSSFSGEPQFKTLQFSVGAEYAYQDQFFVRTGYYYEDPTKGDRKYFSVGVGLKYNVMGLNFSYLVPSGSGTNRNPLSNTLRFGLVFDIDTNEGSNTSTQSTTN